MEPENNRIDVEHLIGEVAARHGILLKRDDAAFALVTLNQLVLEETRKRILEEVRSATAEFEEAAGRVQTRAGSILAQEVKEAASAVRNELRTDIAEAGVGARQIVVDLEQAHNRAVVAKWITIGVCCGLSLFLIGVFVGRMLP